MELTYKEFLEKVNKSSIELDNIYSYYVDIVKFYHVVKDQKESYFIKDEENLFDKSLDSQYADFGLYFGYLSSYRLNYLMIIDPNKPINTEIEASRYSMPSDSEPTHLVVLSSDGDVIESVLNQIKEIYPDIRLTQMVNIKTYNESIKNNIINRIGTDKVYDVSDICVKLSQYDTYSYKYLDEFSKAVDFIKDNKGSNIVIYAGPDSYESIYRSLIIELYLRYGISCYISSHAIKHIMREISDSLIGEDCMLVEERVKYLTNLPFIMVKYVNDRIIYNIIKSSKIYLKLTYINIESKSINDRKTAGFTNADNIKILSIYDFHDIDTVEGCRECRSRIDNLYELLGIENDIIDVTKLIFFSKDGIVYVGYVHELNCEVDAILFRPKLGICNTKLDIKDIRSLAPIDLFIDGRSDAMTIMKSLSNKNNFKLPPTVKTGRKLTELIKNSCIRVREDWKESKINLSTFGLYGKTSRYIRQGFGNNFDDIEGRGYTRDRCDCFGGFTPMLVRYLSIGLGKDIDM